MNDRRRITPFALALLFLAAVPALAQHEAGIRFDVADPQGDFAENVSDPGFGLAAHYGYAVNPNLTFGGGLNYLMYGSQKRRVSIPLVEDPDLVTNNNIAGFFLMVQANLLDGPVTPYVEGRWGGLYLWTESKLEDADWIDDDDISETVNYDDFTSQIGFGGGLRFEVSRGDRDDPRVLIDLKIMAMHGGEAEYLTEDGIELEGDVPVFDPQRSETDLVYYELGVVLGF